ncbi:MAG TPA: response regulator [Aggregatilineales bacterium]|nr:response regulator [Anaerolineae bacterium]HUN05375.1 response regulator [Aggregatilineales bacterium]
MTTWMVVEDEPGLYELVLALYDLMGVDGISFTNGEDALAWIDEVEEGNLLLDEVPSLALLDIRLPGQVSGPDVGQRLRQCERTKDMVIVLMTAYRMSPDQRDLLVRQSGADHFLEKPLPDIPVLMKLLEDLFAARASNPKR